VPSAWLHIAEMLAQNFARAVEMIEYLRCPDSTRRVAAMLLSMAGNRGEPLRVSQVEIAEMTHLSRTTVQQSLVELARLGLVGRGYSSIEIVDPAGLRRFAQTPAED
jgi:CRP-like cAMP-binding protein